MWKIGHRGACGHAPENTLLSMRRALALGVDGFEFDIRLSRDNQPVVIHDDTLERTTNGHGPVSGLTLAELQTLDAGKGERIPSLRDVFALVDKRCRLFIELKAAMAHGPVAALVEEQVQKHGWRYDQLFICSFDHTQLAAIRALNAQMLTCALFVGIPVSLSAMAEEAGAWSINPNIHHISQALVDDAHRRGLRVLAWTLNEPAQIAKARALCMDGMFSDFPERL